jgi:[acyl-carrier-protein] S-malonyltransferase
MSSVESAEYADPATIGPLMVRQLASPVRWVATVRALLAAGVDTFVECGPGKVLTGLNRRIEKRPDVACLALEDVASLESARSTLATGRA